MRCVPNRKLRQDIFGKNIFSYLVKYEDEEIYITNFVIDKIPYINLKLSYRENDTQLIDLTDDIKGIQLEGDVFEIVKLMFKFFHNYDMVNRSDYVMLNRDNDLNLINLQKLMEFFLIEENDIKCFYTLDYIFYLLISGFTVPTRDYHEHNYDEEYIKFITLIQKQIKYKNDQTYDILDIRKNSRKISWKYVRTDNFFKWVLELFNNFVFIILENFNANKIYTEILKSFVQRIELRNITPGFSNPNYIYYIHMLKYVYIPVSKSYHYSTLLNIVN